MTYVEKVRNCLQYLAKRNVIKLYDGDFVICSRDNVGIQAPDGVEPKDVWEYRINLCHQYKEEFQHQEVIWWTAHEHPHNGNYFNHVRTTLPISALKPVLPSLVEAVRREVESEENEREMSERKKKYASLTQKIVDGN